MNIWIFIISVIGVTVLLIGMNYTAMYNYATYVVPIKNVILHVDEVPPHLETLGISDFKNGMPPTNKNHAPIKNTKYNKEDDSITIFFGGGGNEKASYPIIPDFDYVETFHKNQTFLVHCIEYSDYTFLWFYKIIGIEKFEDREYILVWHYEGRTQPMPCDYPEIIKNSIDLVDDHPTDKAIEFFYNVMWK